MSTAFPAYPLGDGNYAFFSNCEAHSFSDTKTADKIVATDIPLKEVVFRDTNPYPLFSFRDLQLR